ncbi:MAG: hypothetical protein IJ737_02305 [Ruminococcus sp.]|nr:hypothetical protein [Ruminococcus sp.]
MKARRVLAIICYTLCMTAYGFCGYFSYLSWKEKISYRYGFLLFLPVWIVSYWFSTFFSQLCDKKEDGKTVHVIPPLLFRILNTLSWMIGIALVGFWIYIYYFRTSPGGGAPI